MTPRSVSHRGVNVFFIRQLIKKLTKNVGFGLCSTPKDLFSFTFPLKARRGLQRQNNAGKTPRSVSQRRVQLRAMLVSEESDSAQC